MPNEHMRTLEVGYSYWIRYQSRNGTRAFPGTIVEADGEMMIVNAAGENAAKLPDNIIEARKMGEFQRLLWISHFNRRNGNVEQADVLESQAYRAMPDGFYLTRITKLAYYWEYAGGIRSKRLIEEIELLRRLRPDIAVDELPILVAERERAARAAADALEIMDEDSYIESAQHKPSLCERIVNLFNRIKAGIHA